MSNNLVKVNAILENVCSNISLIHSFFFGYRFLYCARISSAKQVNSYFFPRYDSRSVRPTQDLCIPFETFQKRKKKKTPAIFSSTA
jgi:hypothetical protein